jgi:hypothetical protein
MSFNSTPLSSSPFAGTSLSYSEARPFLKWVFAWMGLGLLVTSMVGYYVSSNTGLQLQIVGNRGLFLGLIIGTLVLVLVLTWAINRLSPIVAALLFLAYAALNGVTLSVITLVYTSSSIVSAMVTTTIVFGVMAVFGFTTSIDLSRFSRLLIIGVIGLIVAGLVNLFLRSDEFSLLISVVGVVVFIGLTAWDVQKLKRMAALPEIRDNPEAASKYAVYGALTLYLDFINLFLFILRLLGRRR